jgi:hypothetical protein
MAITNEQRSELLALVVTMFNAPPGKEVLADLENAREAGMSLESIAEVLATKPQFTQIYPLQTAEEFAARMVGNLLPATTPADAAAWSTQWIVDMLNDGMSRAQVLVAAYEALRDTDNEAYANAQTLLTNRVDVANHYSVVLALPSATLAELQAVLSAVTVDPDSAQDVMADLDDAAGEGDVPEPGPGEDPTDVPDDSDTSDPDPIEEPDDTAVEGETFILTSDTDTIIGTAGNDTIAALGDGESQTLSAADTINGGAGTDTLNLSFEAAAADVTNGAVIQNVEVLSVRQLAGTAVLDADKTAGLTAINLIASAGDLTVTNLASGAAAGIIGDGTTTEGVLNFAYKTATAAVTLNLADGVKQVANAAQIIVSGSATTATLNSTGAANTTGGIVLSSADTVTALTINADTDLTVNDGTGGTIVNGVFFDDPEDDVPSGIEIEGFKTGVTNNRIIVRGAASSVSLNQLDPTVGILDASGLTAGGVTARFTNSDLVIAKGGAGRDTITVEPWGPLSAGSSVDLGAGDDKLFGSGFLSPSTGRTTLGDQIADGGAGVDTISASLINLNAIANVKNFEVMDLTWFDGNMDAAWLATSSITKLSLEGIPGARVRPTGATLYNLPSNIALEVTGAILINQPSRILPRETSVGLYQQNAGTNTTDVLEIIFNANVAAAASTVGNGNYSMIEELNAFGAETVRITSTGGTHLDGNTIMALNDPFNQMQKVVITGDKAFYLDDASTNAIVETTVADVASSLALIDGSAATGKLSITAGASDEIPTTAFKMTYTGLTIKGGAADDTIALAAKNGVVDAGAGDDFITISNADAGIMGNVSSVTGGVGADTVNSQVLYGATASATSGAMDGNYVVFTDAAAQDVLATGAFTNADGSFGAAADVGIASTFDQAVFHAEADAGAATTVIWFQYNGNTYVMNTGEISGDSADNVIIKLTGLADLAGATLDSTAGTITLA